MNFNLRSVNKNMFWQVPLSIITFAAGIYLSLICLFPSFVPEHHEMVMNGLLFVMVPYAIFVLIGIPMLTLWYYARLYSEEEYKKVVQR
jgi:hypothetical protein